MRYLFFWVVVGFVIIPGCQDSTSSIDKTLPDVQLNVVDVGCTDALLHIQFAKSVTGKALELYRDGENLRTMTVSGSDTLIWDDSLAQNTNYQWRIQWRNNTDKKADASASTLPVTSHVFSWQSWEFGENIRTSFLYDISIISESDIWAVGEIYTEDSYTYDSLGNWILPYNAVHWDGNDWELKRILWEEWAFSYLKTVQGFSEHDVFYGVTNLMHWNGEINEQVEIPDDAFLAVQNGIWGNSADFFVIAGDNGSIAQRANGTWSKIESGTSLRLLDVHGNSRNDFVIAGHDRSGEFGAHSVLFYGDQSGNLNTLYYDPAERFAIKDPDSLSGFIASACFLSNYRMAVCTGNGVYFNRAPDYSRGKRKWNDQNALPAYCNRIRGTDFNNIFMVGHFGAIIHYNGQEWEIVDEYYNNFGIQRGLSMKGNMVAIAGSGRNGKASIIIGRK
jgi:hypothetical protein